MSRLIAVLGITAALGLGSCVHQQGAAPPMAWSLHQTPEEGVKLAYGAPASDNVVLMMTCQPGSDRVLLSTTSAGGPARIVLKSGRDRSALPATAAPSGLGEGQILEAAAAPSDKALAGFARNGELSLVQTGRDIALPAPGEQMGDVTRFFDACSA
jgi:hypothetical protein